MSTQAEAVQGSITGNNNESVLLEQNEGADETSISKIIEDKLRRSMDIHYFVSSSQAIRTVSMIETGIIVHVYEPRSASS